jgi:hypothetical protein
VAAKAELVVAVVELATVEEQVGPALILEEPPHLYPVKLEVRAAQAAQIPEAVVVVASKFHQLADLADLELLLLGTADKILLSSCC